MSEVVIEDAFEKIKSQLGIIEIQNDDPEDRRFVFTTSENAQMSQITWDTFVSDLDGAYFDFMSIAYIEDDKGNGEVYLVLNGAHELAYKAHQQSHSQNSNKKIKPSRQIQDSQPSREFELQIEGQYLTVNPKDDFSKLTDRQKEALEKFGSLLPKKIVESSDYYIDI